MTNPLFSVVVVTGEMSAGLRLTMALQSLPGVHVTALDAREDDLLESVQMHDALVVVADASLLADGSGRVDALRAARDAIGLVIVDEQPSLATAVQALRARVDEFFPGEVSDERLRQAVEAVALDVRGRLGPGSVRSVLVVAESLEAALMGAGGTIRMHADAGDRVVVAALDVVLDEADPKQNAVARHLGASIVPLAPRGASKGDMLRALARLEAAHRPGVVYTHSASDASMAQCEVLSVVVEAMSGVARISCMQSARSSIDFSPTLFIDIDRVLEQKTAALDAWVDHPGAIDVARADAMYWSRFGTGRLCEPFELLRDAVSMPDEVERSHDARASAGLPRT